MGEEPNLITDLQKYNTIDSLLLDIAKSVKPLYYSDPKNIKEQKELFLQKKIKNPTFQYKDIEYDPKQVEEKLNSVEIPDDELGKIYQIRKRHILLENDIIVNRGNKDIVINSTIEINDKPDEELVKYADSLLKEIPYEKQPTPILSSKIKESLENELTQNGLTDWVVEYSDKKLTTVYAAGKKITICKDRMFKENDPKRLAIHEIGVHALRAANGYEQLLKIFAIGLPSYMATEEGLTTYFEEKTGFLDEQLSRDYALRVIAVDSVLQNLDFRNTFDRLKSYDTDNTQAWDLSLRVHRGGGFIKDHIYLDGFIKVKDFAKNNDFKTLFVGKIGLKDLDLTKKLLEKKILKEAIHLPYFL